MSGWALDALAGAIPDFDSLRDRRIDTTLDVVAEAFNTDRRALTAANLRTKDKTLMVARQLAAYLLHEDCGLSFKESATRMGWRNHTSAKDAFDHIAGLTKEASSQKLRDVIGSIREMVDVDMKKMTIDKPNPPKIRMN